MVIAVLRIRHCVLWCRVVLGCFGRVLVPFLGPGARLALRFGSRRALGGLDERWHIVKRLHFRTRTCRRAGGSLETLPLPETSSGYRGVISAVWRARAHGCREGLSGLDDQGMHRWQAWPASSRRVHICPRRLLAGARRSRNGRVRLLCGGLVVNARRVLGRNLERWKHEACLRGRLARVRV